MPRSQSDDSTLEPSGADDSAVVGIGTAAKLVATDPTRALELAKDALAAASDSSAKAEALLLIGELEHSEGHPTEAREPLERALELFREGAADSSVLKALVLLARVERDVGRLDEAAQRVTAALELARREQNRRIEAEALNIKAAVLGTRGDYVGALDCLERALEISDNLGLREQQASILSNLGTLRRQMGDYPGALASLKAAYELIRTDAPESRNEAVNLLNLGHVYDEMSETAAALDYFSKAREVGRLASNAMIEVASLNSLANVHSRSGDLARARELYDEALAESRRMGFRQYEIDNLDGLGQVYAGLGEHHKASEAHRAALLIAREIDDPEGEIDALLNLGRDYLAMGSSEEALVPLHEACRLAEGLGRKRSQFEAHDQLARAYERQGRFEEALGHHQAFYQAEKVVFNEESEDRVRRLTVQFDVERARHEAETYRVRTEVEQQAREQAEAMVRERTRELEEAQQEIVARLAIAGEYRDDGTGEHTRRVGRNAAAIARALDWPEDEAELLYSAARLHDVGKIGIRDSVLLKPGKLSDEEFELMRGHAMIGGRILSGGHSRLLRMAEEIAFAHHERWDGKGYPNGLSGEEIPMSARIVAVSDVLDALTHERPYKDAWPVSNALAEIQSHSGTQFDPRVVAACLEVFNDRGGPSPTDNVPATTVEPESGLVDDVQESPR